MGKRNHNSAEEMVAVFEGQNSADVDKIKDLLEQVGISAQTEESPMVFPDIASEFTWKVMVKLKDEKSAFEVIDNYFKEQRKVSLN